MNLSKDIVYITAECLVGLLSILSNSVVLISLYRFQQLQTITNYFVGSLALADMLVGLAVPPVVIYPYFGLPRDFHGCVLVSSLVILLTNISVLNLVAVALERYLAIRRPFLYDRAASHSKALHVIIFTWLLAIVLGLVPVMGWNRGHDTFNGTCGFLAVMDLSYLTYFLFFGFLAPCLLFVFLVYAYIFYTIHRQQRKTSVMVSPQSTLDGPEMLSFAEVLAAKRLFIVFVFFAACWLPINSINAVFMFAPDVQIPDEVVLFAVTLSHANSFVNPFVYALGRKQFREAFKKVLSCR